MIFAIYFTIIILLHSGHQYSFLCPNGTVFNQAVRVCDWWSNVNCASSEQLYQNNDELYRIPDKQQQQQNVVWYKADDEYRIGKVNRQRGGRQRQFLSQNKSNNSNSNNIVDDNALINYSKITKNSFRGSLRHKSNSQSSYSSSQQQSKTTSKSQTQQNNYSKVNSEYHSRQNNSSRNNSRNNKKKQNSIGNIPSRRTSTQHRSNNNSSTSNNHNSNNNYNSKQRSSHRYNLNRFENDDELKDYKSKIKNKFNIDYDHSLDEEYEIIEAIEWNDGRN